MPVPRERLPFWLGVLVAYTIAVNITVNRENIGYWFRYISTEGLFLNDFERQRTN